jgi:hypothetical protein
MTGVRRGHRRTPLVVAGVLFAAVAAVLLPPPAALADSGDARWIVALLSAAIVAFAVLPLLVWRSVARPGIWIGIAVAALVLGVSSFLAAGAIERSCTARYAGKSIIIGTELTPLAAEYKRTNPGLSNDDLVFDAAGVPDRVWTTTSIGRCRAWTGSTYFLAIPFLVVCLVATAEALPMTMLTPARWGGAAPMPSRTGTPVQYDVFVSYRHDPIDRAFVTDLVSSLEADGYRVAIDERDFPANASFLLEMERCVRESRFTIAVLSPRYLESGHTQEEAIICKVLDMGDRKRRLIPMVIESVAMPAWLYGIVGIDCTRRDPLLDPYEKLKATLGAPLMSMS